MNDITQNWQTCLYNHKTMVNDPPFISNFPLLKLRAKQKREFKENELDLFHKKYSEDKVGNKVIGVCLLAILTSVLVSARYIYKKIKLR